MQIRNPVQNYPNFLFAEPTDSNDFLFDINMYETILLAYEFTNIRRRIEVYFPSSNIEFGIFSFSVLIFIPRILLKR